MQKKRILFAVCIAIFLTGCGFNPVKGMENSEKSESKPYEIAAVNSYDSMDVAIVKSINLEEKSITLINTNVSKSYTLTYDGTTNFYDRNHQSLAAMQIQAGDVVEVTFLKTGKLLNTLELYKDAWVKEEVTAFQIANSGKVIEIYGEKYRFTEDSIVIMPDGMAGLMDINVTDTLKVTGVDHDVFSITVTKGHGYLRLSNDSNVIGGWIEVGNSIIRPITEDMLMLVPEGEFDVNVSVGNASLKRKVVIKRDQETVFDCSSFEPEEIKYGSILFTVEPENTNVYIDGTKVDLSAPVELEYGIHQMIARANGYETLSKYIKVGSEYAALTVLLEKAADAETEEKTESGEEASGQSETESATASESGTESESSAEASQSQQEGVTETNSAESGESQTESVSSESKEVTESKETAESKDSALIDTTASTTYRVYVDAPAGVEVYLDGTYVGLSPINFKKTPGSHTITLRKSGYITRSYTIQIDDEQKDISYSFSELESLSN